MTFLPPNYEVPKGLSGYMKLEKGLNEFRILSSPITGWVYWNIENKPVRSRTAFKSIPADIRLDAEEKPTRVKHFWAFVVWNYKEQAVQILELTQSTIQGAMKIKIDNRKGDAHGYDFLITRTGEGLGTDYDVDVSEASPVPSEAEIAFKSKNINLEALYEGGDPFTAKEVSVEEAMAKF